LLQAGRLVLAASARRRKRRRREILEDMEDSYQVEDTMMLLMLMRQHRNRLRYRRRMYAIARRVQDYQKRAPVKIKPDYERHRVFDLHAVGARANQMFRMTVAEIEEVAMAIFPDDKIVGASKVCCGRTEALCIPPLHTIMSTTVRLGMLLLPRNGLIF
jgi:hypothetical protein